MVGDVGLTLGLFVGGLDGLNDGLLVGAGVGLDVGALVGLLVGAGVGDAVGYPVGAGVGVCVGEGVGDLLGFVVGAGVGLLVGALVGNLVGDLVGDGLNGIGISGGTSDNNGIQPIPLQAKDRASVVTIPAGSEHALIRVQSRAQSPHPHSIFMPVLQESSNAQMTRTFLALFALIVTPSAHDALPPQNMAQSSSSRQFRTAPLQISSCEQLW